MLCSAVFITNCSDTPDAELLTQLFTLRLWVMSSFIIPSKVTFKVEKTTVMQIYEVLNDCWLNGK